MSFSFNFLPPDGDDGEQRNTPQNSKSSTTIPLEPSSVPAPQNESSTFRWFTQEEVKSSLEDIVSNYRQFQRASRNLRLSSTESCLASTTQSCAILRQVQEEAASGQSTLQQQQYSKTDLVPGVYEGGLKVWECSMDLCQYLQDHDVKIQGHVLELGCGHGLPACWVLKKALSQQDNGTNCWVTFSDYNDFVLRDVTLRNVYLNAHDAKQTNHHLTQWLSEHTAFAAGDWNKMSEDLFQPMQQQQPQQSPAALPKDGLFDCILAAETTYSEAAAVETARLIAKHLRPKRGVAYVASKRYYFGVRGGTSCLVDALKNEESNENAFDIQVLEEYDNGVGNIRELLCIQNRSS